MGAKGSNLLLSKFELRFDQMFAMVPVRVRIPVRDKASFNFSKSVTDV